LIYYRSLYYQRNYVYVVMASLLTFEFRSNEFKDYTTDICCSRAKHAVLKQTG